ncbi:MAG: outer membrane lipoprotein carrier protein LolA [Rickettsiaceae bacterium]|nr:outer membrane lipoprotein carrier protein LolA [Rickettsiaceae bacterium]
MRTIYLLIITLLFSATCSFATEDAISEFKSYLTTLKSVAVEFKQHDSRGGNANGRLIIVKPYNFLCNYFEPYPIVIAGNKRMISVYDFDMEQLNRINAKENIFGFLLADDIDLNKHFKINYANKDSKKIEVELYHIESERTTRVTISIKGTPMLKSIVTEESDGNVISMEISHIWHIKDVSNSLFIMKNPEIYGHPTRLNSTDLEKKYRIVE